MDILLFMKSTSITSVNDPHVNNNTFISCTIFLPLSSSILIGRLCNNANCAQDCVITIGYCYPDRDSLQCTKGGLIVHPLNIYLHVDGRISFNERPFVAHDAVVIDAVSAVQYGPVCGQLDHHVLPSIATRGLIQL